MNFPEEQINELKNSFPDNEIQKCEEAGITYFLIPAVTLPDGCTPNKTNLLFCPTPREGYPSRLLFSDKIQTKQKLNWNAELVVLGTKWFAYSWKTDGGTSLLNTLFMHLRALK